MTSGVYYCNILYSQSDIQDVRVQYNTHKKVLTGDFVYLNQIGLHSSLRFSIEKYNDLHF